MSMWNKVWGSERFPANGLWRCGMWGSERSLTAIAIRRALFSSGELGAAYVVRPIVSGNQALFQDLASVSPVTSDGDPNGLMIDQSPNSINASQSTSAARPTYNANPDRLSLDKVDDALIITVPAGGWTGTMVLATDQGTASYGVSIPAGSYGLGGQYFPGNAIVGALFRNGAMTSGEKADTESYFVGNGATASYGAVTNFSFYWQYRIEITEFPIIDVSNGNNFTAAWQGRNDNSEKLVSFPLLDFSSGSNFLAAWQGQKVLTNFPQNSFDNVAGGNFNSAFNNTNLTQASIDGILVSLVASGIATGTRGFTQSGGSAPSVGTGQPAIDTLRSRGWTVGVTGGY